MGTVIYIPSILIAFPYACGWWLHWTELISEKNVNVRLLKGGDFIDMRWYKGTFTRAGPKVILHCMKFVNQIMCCI